MKLSKVIQNIIGKKGKTKDTDMDGVSDKKDCQPKNSMRQDVTSIAKAGMGNLQQNIEQRNNFGKRRYSKI